MKIVTIIAAVIWTISLILAFVIKSDSPYLWLPDALLLAGFLPLLITLKPSWPWIVFGLGNLIIGFVLIMTHYLPDSTFDQRALVVKHHLTQMHIAQVWLIAGVLAIGYGMVRMLKNLIVRLMKKRSGN